MATKTICSNCGIEFKGACASVLDGNLNHQKMCSLCAIKLEHEAIKEHERKRLIEIIESESTEYESEAVKGVMYNLDADIFKESILKKLRGEKDGKD